MKKKIKTGVILMLLVCGFAWKGFCELPAPEHAEALALVSLVRDAASKIAKQGENIFPEFRKPNSLWFHDEIYIFVLDPQGQLYVNGAQPDLEGSNVLELKDEGGKPFVRDYVNLVHQNSDGETWAHYQWHRPPSEDIQWKMAFIKSIKAPSGKEYIVGSGLYGLKMEKMFVVDTVRNAVQMIEQMGPAAFAILNDKTSQFQYQDVYVFVIDEKGMQLAHANPDMVGTNVLDLQDKNGKFIVKDMLEAIKTENSGWLEYWAPKPNETEPSKKHSYFQKVTVKGKSYLVGAGVYLE